MLLVVELPWVVHLLFQISPDVRARAAVMGVSYEQMSVAEYQTIKETVIATNNMDEILLEKAPKIAVYAPPEDTLYRDPWDDAVKLALDYAEIPYDQIWDKEVQRGALQTENYDWLHLHHEDFTGQHGKVSRILFTSILVSATHRTL